MAQEIKLPKISDSQETGVVADIYISEGEQVDAEQSIIAVESDKATVDVPVEERGTIKEIRVDEGEEVSTGDVIATIEIVDKEEAPGTNEETKEQEAENTSRENTSQQATEEEKDNSPNQREQHNGAEKNKDSSDVPAAPLAKKFARELGIDIEELASSDPEERINRADVLAYAKELIQQKQSGSKSTPNKEKSLSQIELPDFTQWGEIEEEPMDGIRYATAENTLKSWQNIPHVTHFDKADVSSLESYRKDKNQQLEEKLTVTAILLKICAEALVKFPKFNASLDINERKIIYKKYVNIGVAVDTENGLLLPVVKDADKKNIKTLTKELGAIGEKARAGKLSKKEMEGGNFVISNLGGIGGNNFTPVIFPPQVAILGVSKNSITPVYNKDRGAFEPKTMLPLSLSYDHRLIDGAGAARFLKWICESLAQPINMLM